MHGGFMDNTEVNISQEIPAYERRYRKISEWFLNCKPAHRNNCNGKNMSAWH